MRMLNKYCFLCFALLLLGASACLPGGATGEEEIEEEIGPLDYTKGIYVVNQGLTQNSDQFGSITFVERREGGRTVPDIFRTTNLTRDLGNLTHSMYAHNGLGYIISTNADRIDVVNLKDFKFLGPITGLKKPRYMQVVSPGIAWVTQWGENGDEGSIAVVDLASNSVLREIPVRPGPENMLIRDDVVYVANSGGFLLDSVITKLDIESESVLKVIEVGLQPQSFQVDANRAIWVIARGSQNFDITRKGRLTQLVNDQVAQSFPIDHGAGNLSINNARDRLFYTMRGALFSHPILQNSISLAPFIDFPYLTAAVDPQTDNIIGTDARNFQIEGRIVVHSPSGEEIEDYIVGIVPINFWFQ